MKKSFIILTLCAAFMFTYGIAYSAITVQSVKGEAALKVGNQWNQIQVGQTLNEGSKISTGVNSSAVLKIDNATLTIKPMTMMKIFKNSANKEVGSHIGLKFGRLNAKVQKIGKLKTNFKISTPVATSSVRGTEEDASNGARKGSQFIAISNELEIETNTGQGANLSGDQVFQQNPDESKPDPLLSDMQDSAFQPLYDPNNFDEQVIQDFANDDISGSSEVISAVDIIDNSTIIPPQVTDTTVNIDIEWP